MQTMNHTGVMMWPPKYSVCGVKVSSTGYDEALHFIMSAARRRTGATVTALAVHGLVLASRSSDFRSRLEQFDLVVPDGQPVRFALNLLYGQTLVDRVYGPELMIRLCRQAAETGVGVYLYGSYPEVVEKLRLNLEQRFPHLKVAGSEPSLFRPLTRKEDQALVDRVNDSGAGVVFLGLGCPLQETFAHEHRESIKAVQVCVGAAFDFYSGHKKMAPVWMQRHGLEWLFRLMQEPRRLWRRYLVTNSIFLIKLIVQLVQPKRFWV